MARSYALKAQVRERAGKGAARAIRREGNVPGVIYGDNKEPVTITFSTKDINLEYYKGHMFTSLCELTVGNDKHTVLARDVQLHPVSDFVQHVDFLRVTKKTRLAVMVPVSFINEEEAPYTEKKGVVNVVRHEVELLCSAMNIPEYIELDMSKFDIGDTVKMSDAILPEGSVVTADRDVTICTIQEPRRLDEEEETAEAEEDAEGEAAEGADAEGGEASEEEAAKEE